MTLIIRMPKLSPTMEEGVITKWHVTVGSEVKPGQVLMEVATDKATVEHQALDGGWLRKLLIAEGHEARINQAVAILTSDPKASIDEVLALVEKENMPAVVASPVLDEGIVTTSTPSSTPMTSARAAQPRHSAFGALTSYDQASDFNLGSAQYKSSPYARKLAEEKGIDLTSVKGTGPGGRVVASDLDNVPSSSRWGVAFDSHQLPEIVPGSFELESLTPMRKSMATLLQESKSSIPHFYLTQEIKSAALLEVHAQLKTSGLKISLNDLIVRATAIALREHPKINSGFDSAEQKIIRFKTVDIAVAVALEKGLITPIVYHADYKSVGQISQQIRQLMLRANAGKLEPHEYKGGSFTISNLGMLGVNAFQAIINPPQAAILAIGAAVEKPLVVAGQLTVGSVMTLTLSCDHRVLDGADGARFLVTLRQLLESPSILLVN